MTVTPGFTAEEITEFVRQYLAVPHGSKGQWLVGKPFTESQILRWRRAYLAGDIGRGLVPRSGLSNDELLVRVREAEEELERVRAERDAQVAKLDAQIVRQDAQIRMLEEGTVVLGKAFGLLQKLSSQEPGNKQM